LNQRKKGDHEENHWTLSPSPPFFRVLSTGGAETAKCFNDKPQWRPVVDPDATNHQRERKEPVGV